jgi:phenylacetate-CoA ligase
MHYQRETIEKAFQCKVFDFYGMAERAVFATECEFHNGKHINMDFSIVEILDQNYQPVTGGEMGRIVATSLYNYGMPLIRYQTSDITAMLKDECQCGRYFQRMENITTKDEDIVTTLDDRYISSSILNALTHNFTNIAEHQIIQEDRNNITVKIVRRNGYNNSDTKNLTDGLKMMLGAEMNVKLEFVESIPRTSAGKYRWVISKVPLRF